MCACVLYACCYLCAVCVCSVTGLDNDMTSDDTKRELKPEKKKLTSRNMLCVTTDYLTRGSEKTEVLIWLFENA